MLRAIGRKLIQGLTTAACAVLGATLAISAIDGTLHWFGTDAAIRVGLPAFAIGLLFFPVNERTLASRAWFALRAAVATLASCVVHRVLIVAAWRTMERANEWVPMSEVPLGAFVEVLRGPWLLLPEGGADVTWLLAMGAIAGATVTAALAQPVLLKIARAQRAARTPSALAALQSAGRRQAPMVRG